MSFRRFSLRARLLVLGVVLTGTPLVIVAGFSAVQGDRMASLAREECGRLASDDLNHMAKAVYDLCLTQQGTSERVVTTQLGVARRLLKAAGSVSLGTPVPWTAVAQSSKVARQLSLPQVSIGRLALPLTASAAARVPVVDELRELVGAHATVFQRMGPAGDMLRVATTVVGSDGRRATGTYIEAQSPDGVPNPVIASVLAGKTYVGRARVLDEWYFAAYDPLRDASGHVIGMLFVGMPDEAYVRLRDTIIKQRIGASGYVYVLDSEGRYVISKDGARDGERLWDSQDDTGRYFIREAVATAKALKPGDVGNLTYAWKNAGDAQARQKTVRLTYFAPWDWTIGVGVYDDEVFAAEQKVAAVGRQSVWATVLTALVAVLVATGIWYYTARSMGAGIQHAVTELHHGAEQIQAASTQVAASAQSLSSGATEQAASLEETSASMEQMADMTRGNAEHANQAAALMRDVERQVSESNRALEAMVTSMSQIQESSDKVAKIIKTIDDIAFQTNILALNAAVEAARAGEAGLGFAVVADEVRSLAQRSAQATRDTASLIETSIARAAQGSRTVTDVAASVDRITSSVAQVKALVDEVSVASVQQSGGITQVTRAIRDMEQVTQTTAATAEESAAASEELNAQAETAMAAVRALATIVEGSRRVDTLRPARSRPALRVVNAGSHAGAVAHDDLDEARF